MNDESGVPFDDAEGLYEDPVKEVSTTDGSVVVRLAGELDLHNAAVVREALLESAGTAPERLVVDLGDVRFIDSTALGVLIGAVKRLRGRDGALTLVNTDANIAKTFEITGLDQIFTIAATREEAIAALDGDPQAA